MAAEVKDGFKIQRFDPQRPYVETYLDALQQISLGGLPSAELKSQYRAATKTFNDSNPLVTGPETDLMLAARKKALVTIARTEISESGRPAPTDNVLARKLAAALSKAAKAKNEWVKAGTNVQVSAKLDAPGAMGVADKFLLTRQAGATGTMEGYFMSSGGDIWAVKHADGSIAAYALDEMTPLDKAKKGKGRDLFVG